MFHFRNRLGVKHCIEEKKIEHISICFRIWKETPGFLGVFQFKPGIDSVSHGQYLGVNQFIRH